MKSWFEDSSDHCSFIPFIQGWYKDQKDRDHNLTNFARYEMNCLKNISVIIYPPSRGSQWICSHARSLKHPWRCKSISEATKPEHFLNQTEEKKRSCLTGDASLVYCHQSEVPTGAWHQRMAAWLCQCSWPLLLFQHCTTAAVPHCPSKLVSLPSLAPCSSNGPHQASSTGKSENPWTVTVD